MNIAEGIDYFNSTIEGKHYDAKAMAVKMADTGEDTITYTFKDGSKMTINKVISQ